MGPPSPPRRRVQSASRGRLLLNEGLVLREKAIPIAQVLSTHARTLSELSQRTAKNLWQMGKILADVQKRLASHNGGTFQQWVTDNAPVNVKMAYRLIDIYRAFSYDNLSQLDFGTSALYLLAQPSTPTSARAEALQRAQNGEAISHSTAQQIVQQHVPPKPELPPLPPKPQTPEYKDFERQELMPQLHDAGDPDAPQVLSGQQEELRAVPEERKEQARTSLKNAIFDVIKTVNVEDDEAIGECADEVYAMFGQNDSISIAARVGAELERGPKTLSDLVALAAWVCNTRLDKAPRNEYLRWRKRVLRLIDAITCGGGLLIYQHRLENGQIAYGLIEDPPNCP